MSSFYTIKQRLARLEQRIDPPPKIGKLAASGFFDTDEGELFLEAQPPERREALLSADHFSCTDMERAAAYPPFRAQTEAFVAAWRKERGLPSRGEIDLLGSW